MQDKNTYINKLCRILQISKKDLALLLDKTLKTIDNWSNNENQIPNIYKINMNLMLENKKVVMENKHIRESVSKYIIQTITEENVKLLDVKILLDMIKK